jgi:hypothetical protein
LAHLCGGACSAPAARTQLFKRLLSGHLSALHVFENCQGVDPLLKQRLLVVEHILLVLGWGGQAKGGQAGRQAGGYRAWESRVWYVRAAVCVGGRAGRAQKGFRVQGPYCSAAAKAGATS